jgi:hypothetical protein
VAIYSLNHSSVGRSTHAAGTAGAHVGYITRSGACLTVMAERMPSAGKGQRGGEARVWLDAQEAADRKNARVIDKVMLALPRELTAEQQAVLVRDFAETVTLGRASWLAAIHQDHPDNPHAHLVIRDKDPETGKRVVGLSEKGSTERMREAWEVAANLALEKAGREERIDRRSLKDQGADREATIHVGPQPAAMERQGKQIDSQVREVPKPRGGVREVRWPEIDGGRSRATHNDRVRARNAARDRARGPQGVAGGKPAHLTRKALQQAAEGRPDAASYATMPRPALNSAWDAEFRLILKSVQDRAAKLIERIEAARKKLADRMAVVGERDERLRRLQQVLANPMRLRQIARRILEKANPHLTQALDAVQPAPVVPDAKAAEERAAMLAQAQAVHDREKATELAKALLSQPRERSASRSVSDPVSETTKLRLTFEQDRAAVAAAGEAVQQFEKAAWGRRLRAYGYGDDGEHWLDLDPGMRATIDRFNAMAPDDQAKTLVQVKTGTLEAYRQDPSLIERDRERQQSRGLNR